MKSGALVRHAERIAKPKSKAASMKQKLLLQRAATLYAALTLSSLALSAFAQEKNPDRNAYFGEEHIRVPAAGDDAGAFLDARVAHASEQPDARCDVLAWLGSIARGKRRCQQRSEQQSFYLAPGHIGGGLRSGKQHRAFEPNRRIHFKANGNYRPLFSNLLFMSFAMMEALPCRLLMSCKSPWSRWQLPICHCPKIL